MKKMLALTVALLFSFSMIAHADLLPTLEPEATPLPKAPSYGAMADVGPVEVNDVGGKSAVKYTRVTESDYAEFSKYMEELGYSASDISVEGRTVKATLSNGIFNIGFSYDADSKVMELTYEAGVKFERAVCSTCKGTGMCQATSICNYGACKSCNGTGKYPCVSCKGKALCSWCKGSGIREGYNSWHTCSFCSGSGWCRHCDGTGYLSYDCSVCHGSGKCSACEGTGHCTTCHGTGVK